MEKEDYEVYMRISTGKGSDEELERVDELIEILKELKEKIEKCSVPVIALETKVAKLLMASFVMLTEQNGYLIEERDLYHELLLKLLKLKS